MWPSSSAWPNSCSTAPSVVAKHLHIVHLYFCFVSTKNIYIFRKNIYIYSPAHRAAVPAVVHEEPRVHRRGVTQPGLDTGISSGGIIIINYYLSIPLSCIQRTLRGWLARSRGSQSRTEQALPRPVRCGPASCAESGQSNSLNHNHDMVSLYDTWECEEGVRPSGLW